MDLELIRMTFTDNSTIGKLYVNKRFECFTLEDVVRPVKIVGMTAIPSGHYELVITYSARFERPLPLLLNVPNYEGVRIHTGNTERDTSGCILVGQVARADRIENSGDAFKHLFPQLEEAARREKIFLLVRNQAADER